VVTKEAVDHGGVVDLAGDPVQTRPPTGQQEPSLYRAVLCRSARGGCSGLSRLGIGLTVIDHSQARRCIDTERRKHPTPLTHRRALPHAR
jgi:hypothetical protein